MKKVKITAPYCPSHHLYSLVILSTLRSCCLHSAGLLFRSSVFALPASCLHSSSCTHCSVPLSSLCRPAVFHLSSLYCKAAITHLSRCLNSSVPVQYLPTSNPLYIHSRPTPFPLPPRCPRYFHLLFSPPPSCYLNFSVLLSFLTFLVGC